MTKRVVAAMAVFLVAAALTTPSAEARVRVRHHSSQPAPVEVHIKDLPPIDFKGLTNADALTVAIGKTPLLATAAPGGKPLANLLRGSHLKKLGDEGGYFKVETADKKQGYVIKYAVARGKISLGGSSSASSSSGGSVVIKTASCPAYTLANKTSPVLGTLSAKTKLRVLHDKDSFYQVVMPNGRWAYVEKSAVTYSAK